MEVKKEAQSGMRICHERFSHRNFSKPRTSMLQQLYAIKPARILIINSYWLDHLYNNIFLLYKMVLPGPASTVEEQSLRNFLFSPADRGSKLAVGDSFQMLYVPYILRTLQYIGRVNQLTQPSVSNRLLFSLVHNKVRY